MAVPLLGRARRRRLLFVVLVLLLVVFYMASKQQDKGHTAHFIHAVSPEDDPHFTQHKSPSTASTDESGQPAKNGAQKDLTTAQAKKGTKAEDASVMPAAPSATPDPDEPIQLNVAALTLDELLQRPMDPMAYDTTARPPIKGLPPVLVANQRIELVVDASAVDGTNEHNDGILRRRRIVFVGDVHGQRAALEALLKKINFVAGQDHLVFVGDMINKGPDSAGVVQLAMDLGASAVRGNHEDRVLLAYNSMRALRGGATHATEDKVAKELLRLRKAAAIEAEGIKERAKAKLQRADLLEEYEAGDDKSFLERIGLRKNTKSEEDTINREAALAQLQGDPLENNPFSHGDAPEHATASSLTAQQARWLADLPIVLHLGRIAPSPYTFETREAAIAAAEANARSPFNDVVVAHAGLMPDRPLHRQDPFAVMTMRSLVHPADEVRHEWARELAEKRIRTLARGRIGPGEPVDVPAKKVATEFRRMQREAYGPDPKHPRQYAAAAAAAAAAAEAAAGGSAASRAAAIARAQAAAAQDPSFEPADMVLLPVEGHFSQHPDRIHWAAVWNQVQHANPVPENRTTVIYGHDAVTGLAVPPGVPLSSSSSSSSSSSPSFLGLFRGGGGTTKTKTVLQKGLLPSDTGYTFGLDTGAAYGRHLTALVVEADQTGRVRHGLEQVACPATESQSTS